MSNHKLNSNLCLGVVLAVKSLLNAKQTELVFFN